MPACMPAHLPRIVVVRRLHAVIVAAQLQGGAEGGRARGGEGKFGRSNTGELHWRRGKAGRQGGCAQLCPCAGHVASCFALLAGNSLGCTPRTRHHASCTCRRHQCRTHPAPPSVTHRAIMPVGSAPRLALVHPLLQRRHLVGQGGAWAARHPAACWRAEEDKESRCERVAAAASAGCCLASWPFFAVGTAS